MSYSASLPQPRKDLFDILSARAAMLAKGHPDITQFVFVPDQPHPLWEDSDAVFWEAVQQLMLEGAAGDDELPVAWIGYHVASRFSKKREAQGFLVTDRRLIAKDTVSAIFSTGQARQYPLYQGISGPAGTAAAIVGPVVHSYDWGSAKSLVNQADAERLSAFLVAIVTMVLETLSSTGNDISDAPALASDLVGRVNELGLGAEAKFADDPKHAKHFTKLRKKVPLTDGERILVSFTDSTLVGPYGLLLTDRNVRSKDIGEDPVCTPRHSIDPTHVRTANEHQLIVAPGQVHEVPTHVGAHEMEAIATLIQEWTASDWT